MACVITLVDLWVKSKDRTLTYLLTLATLLALALMHAMNASTGQTGSEYGATKGDNQRRSLETRK